MAEYPLASSRRPLSAGQAILYGGLTVGVLDALAATTNSYLVRGVMPDRLWQSVASGLLGRASFEGGLSTAALGLAIHFFIAFCVVTVYYLVSRQLPVLRQRPLFYGPLYGVAVWLFMTFVVVPLSAIGWTGISLRGVITGIVVHIFCVGLPAVWFVSRA